MYINGFDPRNPDDVKLYWEKKLSWLNYIQKVIVHFVQKLKTF
jgi:hypothetical protein